jgi:hypothetical protein
MAHRDSGDSARKHGVADRRIILQLEDSPPWDVARNQYKSIRCAGKSSNAAYGAACANFVSSIVEIWRTSGFVLSAVPKITPAKPSERKIEEKNGRDPGHLVRRCGACIEFPNGIPTETVQVALPRIIARLLRPLPGYHKSVTRCSRKHSSDWIVVGDRERGDAKSKSRARSEKLPGAAGKFPRER